MTASNADLQVRREEAVARGIASAYPVYAARAENGELFDVEGRRFIDFAGGIAVQNVGHRHPKVVEAAKAQLDCFVHTCFQVAPYEVFVTLAKRLNALAPGAAPKKTLFVTTGAEAVENAVKIARAATGRRGVISFSGAFHGRTLLTMGMTGKVQPYKAGFGPFPGDLYHAPYPMPVHGITAEQTLERLAWLFKVEIEPKDVAAIAIEPVCGEGGFYIAPPHFLQALRTICDEHGIVLIADEIQAGMARTGKYFAIEHAGVVPDLVTVAKSLAAGFPLAGVIGRADIMDASPPGGLGGTYAGNPVACAAALAVLDVIEEEGLLARSLALGERVTARLERIAARAPVAEIRSLGSMVALEFAAEPNGRDAVELTKAVLARCLDDGLILLPCGLYGNVARFLYPITVPDTVLDEGLDIFERALLAVAARPKAA
jgi:4-aminobutyrate aminotransferase